MTTRSKPAAWIFPVCLGAFLAAPSSACAAERVVFHTRLSMVVESVVIENGMAILTRPGGAQFSFPESAIRDILHVEPEPEPEPLIVWPGEAEPYAELIEAAAERHAVEAALIVAVAQVESRFDPLALSPKGAQGLMQLMPATADELDVDDPFDPAQNIEGGTRWLKRLIRVYDGDLELALAAYNAGEGAVERYGGVPPYRETQNYVRSVQERYRRLSLASDPGA